MKRRRAAEQSRSRAGAEQEQSRSRAGAGADEEQVRSREERSSIGRVPNVEQMRSIRGAGGAAVEDADLSVSEVLLTLCYHR